jgi:hypothetical protein
MATSKFDFERWLLGDQSVLQKKLSTLYVLMMKVVMLMEPEHVTKFLNLIATTEIGVILLQFGEKLKKTGMQVGFLLLSKGDVKDTIFLRVYVDRIDGLNEVFGIVTQMGKFLSTQGITIEFETFENAAKVHLIPF